MNNVPAVENPTIALFLQRTLGYLRDIKSDIKRLEGIISPTPDKELQTDMQPIVGLTNLAVEMATVAEEASNKLQKVLEHLGSA